MRTQKEIEDRLYSIRCKIYRNNLSCYEENKLNEMADLLQWVLSNKIEDIIKSDLTVKEKSEKIQELIEEKE